MSRRASDRGHGCDRTGSPGDGSHGTIGSAPRPFLWRQRRGRGMTQRCRLLARAQIGAALLEPGTEFSLKDGEIGPCKTTMYAHETIDLAHDSRRVPPEYVDEPLY